MNGGAALVRPLVGVVSDKLGRITTAAIFTAFNFVLIFAFWIPLNSYAPLLVFALVAGGTSSIYWAVISPLSAGGLSED